MKVYTAEAHYDYDDFEEARVLGVFGSKDEAVSVAKDALGAYQYSVSEHVVGGGGCGETVWISG